jgi:chaperone BCS1
MLEWIKDQLVNNQIAVGGALTVAVSSLAYLMRRIPSVLATLVCRKLLVSVEVRDTDISYHWLANWLSLRRSESNVLCVMSSLDRREGPSVGRSKQRVVMILGQGRHLMTYAGHHLMVERSRSAPASRGESDRLHECETIRLVGPWWSREAITSLLEEARDEFTPSADGSITIRVPRYGNWQQVDSVEARDVDSVVLRRGQMERIVQKVESFLAGRERYARRGVPWRLGMLFHGPTGNGKTSTIKAIAAKNGMDLSIIHLSRDTSDEDLAYLFGQADQSTIIMMEDVDKVLKQVSGDIGEGKVTVGGLLNAIDGATSRQGRILVMTTNDRDALFDALVRPGRIDVVEEFPDSDEDQVVRMFDRFYEGARPDLGAVFAAASAGLSMATVQNRMLDFEDDPEGLVRTYAAQELAG